MGNDNVKSKILEIQVRYEDAIRGIAKYQAELDNLKKKESEYKKELKEQAISLDEYNMKMAESKLDTMKYKEAIQILTKEVQNKRKIEREQVGSLISLRAELSNLTAEYDKLSKAERESDGGKEMAANIKALSQEIKGAEEETGRFYRNVGNYTEAILGATEANVPFINEIHNMVTSLSPLGKYLSDIKNEMTNVVSQYKDGATSTNLLSGAQKAAAVSSNLFSTALKILKVALIATGIGAIVVLLGSLVAWMTKTQKGTEFLSNVMASFGAVVNVLIDRIAKFGGALVKLFSGDFSGAWNDMKDSAKGLGDEIANDAKQAWALNDAIQQLEKQETMLTMKRAASRAEIEKLKLIADDTTKSLKERTVAAQKAYNMENELQKESIEIGKKKLANLLGQVELTDEVNDLINQMAQGAITADEAISKLGLSESTVKDLKEFAQVFSEVAQKEMETYTRNKETQNKINAMNKEAADKVKEMKDKEIEIIRQAEDAMLSLVKEGLDKQRQQLQLSYNREIENLKKKLIEEKNLTAKAKDGIRQIIKAKEQQLQVELQKLSEEQLQKDIANRQKLIDTQLAAVKSGSEQEFQLKMQQIMAQRDMELSNTELTEQMKQAIREKYNKQMDDLSAQRENDIIKKQADLLNNRFASELGILESQNQVKLQKMQNNGVTESQLKQTQYAFELQELQTSLTQKYEVLYNMQQLEGETDEQFNNRKIELKQRIAETEVQIDTVKVESQKALYDDFRGAIDALGEHNKAFATMSKVLALGEIAVNTGKAIAAGVAQAQSVPFPGNIAAIATTIATILSNIATATKSVKSAKFAVGGLATGPGTGTSDSIPANLSDGESVITAKATNMFAPILSAFNMMGGGVPINVTTTSNQTLGEDMLARAVAKGMMMAPPPIVSVEEYTSVANRVKYVEELGNL